jgi:hypothetical protein
MKQLPLRAMYTVGELARAASMDPRAMATLLRDSEVRIFRTGRWYLVSLSELEVKVRPLWDGIQAAEALRRAMEHL